MLPASRNFYSLCVFLVLLLCFSVTYHSFYYGNKQRTGYIWYRPIEYYSNEEEIRTVNKESPSSRDNKTDSNYSVIKPVLSLKDEEASKRNILDSTVRRNSSGIQLIKPVLSGTAGSSSRSTSVNSNHLNNCSRRVVELFQTARPVIGLVSFPGSGNTWTRHLIQQMTGIGTSSVYCDGGLKMRGFPFECERQKGKTVVVKTHEARNFHMFKKIVLLVRNPYEALLSYFNFAKAGHTGHPSKAVLIQASIKMFDHSLRWYVNLTRNTKGKFKGPVYILQYEKLKTDMARELRKLATFLNTNVTDRDIECTCKIQEGNFHRRTSDAQHIDLLRAVYDKDKLLRLREAARTSEILIKEAYNIEIDLGGSVENTLFQTSR